jgi:hypothetical protein
VVGQLIDEARKEKEMRFIHNGAFLLVVLSVLVPAALGRDINDPPWDASLPNQTSQAWEFTDLTFPYQPFAPVTFSNDYGEPTITTTTVTWPDIVPGPEGIEIPTLHIDEPGGLTIWIPNNPDPNLEKLIFWQVTSDKSPTPTGTGPSVTTPGGATGTNLPAPYPQVQYPGTTWYTYNGLIRVVPNPEGEWITFDFVVSTNIEEIVINTVCIPEPATLSLLTLGGLALLRRRGR